MTNKYLPTGGDPRALPDYIALRDELLKLSHPARPDVDWRYAETLCLRLFEHNGVELQTAAWYLLARMHIAGLTGMNEGLSLIGALTAYQWSLLWPGNIHARMEILTSLNKRMQNVFRTLALDDRDDLPLLYQAEKNLTALTQTLTRHELKQASRMDVLLPQIRQAITRLENTPHNGQHEPAVVLPAQTMTIVSEEKMAGPQRLVFVAQPERGSGVTIASACYRRRYIWSFISGICTALVMCAVSLWGWNYLNTLSLAEQQLEASVTPLPDMLSADQLAALRQSSRVTKQQAANLAERTREQVNWLMMLPPDWPQYYSQTLIRQAQMLWPDDPVVLQMHKDWQQYTGDRALPLSALNSWHEGMVKLRQLADKLNTLDERRGKYMTVSELKSSVFAITQDFSKNPPAEEQLRLLAEITSAGLPSAALKTQSELRLQQLLARYSLLTGSE